MFERRCSLYCDYCDRYTLHQEQRLRHGIHLLLGVMTCGLWIPIYLILTMFPNHQCQRCGGEQ